MPGSGDAGFAEDFKRRFAQMHNELRHQALDFIEHEIDAAIGLRSF